jgi:DNA-binding MarR family transcriptional regulator
MNKTLPPEGLIDKVRTAPGFLLWQVEMSWQRIINKALLEFDLTYTQFIVLSICCWLTEENDNVYQHQVAKYSCIDRIMTSRILASLEKKKYINRIKVDGDARAKLVFLTDKGKKILDLSLKRVSDMEANFFKTSDESFAESMEDILSDCANLQNA